MRKLWLLLLGAASAFAHAEDRQGCTSAIEQALRAAWAGKAGLGEVSAQHCKPWPPSASTVMAATMAFQSETGADEAWEVVVGLVDTATRQALQLRWAHVDGDAITGINEYSLRLDTAPYQFKPQLRALGLRFFSSAHGSQYAEAYWGNELTLLIPEGKTLRPVLSLATEAQAHIGKADDDWQVSKLVLSIAPRGPEAWADIVVTDTAGESRRSRRWTYRYDGRAYQIQGNSKPFWAAYPSGLMW